MKYIFEIKIKIGHTVEEYAAAWKRGSEIIQQKSGARNTRLHRKIGDPNTLLAIAEWESKEARDKVMAELESVDEVTHKIVYEHHKFGEFIKIGEYEDAEWEVVP